ncbi:hypothetical protein H6G36_20005 [Anabaena minutissima FACHB-250]|nr:hypothetical protein [Anabaena minutissima FACHB-250]
MKNQQTKTHSQHQNVNKISQLQPLNLEQLTQVNGGALFKPTLVFTTPRV